MRSQNKSPGSDFEALSFDRASLFKKMCEMKERHFYFVADSFYKDFPDPNLMRNKEAINGIRHDRPCFFAITDKRNSELFWFIPISSRVDKYKDFA